MHKRLALTAVFFLSPLCIASPPAPQAPITAKQLLAWVVGGMSMDHLNTEMANRGIAFRPDSPYLELMKSAGATDNLLDLVRHARQAPDAPPPPTTDRAFVKLAAGAKALGAKDNEACEKSLAAAIQLEPKNPDLLFAMGGLFKEIEDWGDVVRVDHQATTIAPDFIEAHLAVSYACYRLENADCTESESKLVLQLQPHDAEAHKDLGLAYMLKNDYQGAAREYREAIRLNPNYANAYYDLGIALHELHDLDGSIAAYQQAVKNDPNNPEQYYNLGISFTERGDHANAIAVYRKAKELDPKRLDVRQNLGHELCASAHYPDAIKEFKELLAIDPGWNMARACLGRSLLQTGQFDEAIAVYRESLRQDPSDDDMARVGLGDALTVKKELREAQAQYEQAVREHPNEPLTHLALGRFHYNQAQFEPGARELEEAVRLDPKNTAYMNLLAEDYEGLEHFDHSQVVIERMIAVLKSEKGESSGEMAEALNHLAVVLSMQRKYDQAKAAELQAIKILEQDPTKADALKTFRDNYQNFLTEESGNSPPAESHKKGAPQATEASQPLSAQPFAPAAGLGGGPNQPDINGIIQEDLRQGQNARAQNRMDEAERYFQQAAEQAEKLPPGDRLQFDALQRLAGIYVFEGRPADAERVQKHVLALAEMAGGPDSPQVASVLENMAMGNMVRNNLPAAQEYGEHALRIREQTSGPADPNLAMSIDLLANIYSASKQYAKAEPLYNREVALTVQARGPDDFLVTTPLDHLGACYKASGQFEKAEETYRRIIAIVEKAYGPNSPLLSGALYSLSEVLRNRGRPAEADEVQKRMNAINASQQRSH